ncbi:preprotein translocase subunit SecG [Deinococcus metallilatus]|uniref:Protein-export membrane protein SecG n=2 Tax=Deinococcus TaxID=1298 RepID=A0AAJ5F2L5_9DEIO|nr:preprotein translocase subunit SecG [Deinococcus metallilatus]MBB5295204.1 preprotein translocase subunit SecG [Deinococcus metallilatus]QBY08631.1 preprotein translocase subunit SecG [Deinococcus metallilatus]RXJ10510.1 preprotein translocase subunit SecG [Deinococcus metallilatus]TLK26481.1 preprotein translocase subunit SecG [Deinococcus metallilatus]GMA14978.1 preprotein translocase subunit SecG [Deinococcus metallilatus]
MILTLFIILFALVCVGLVFFVLLQVPKQAGLTASMASGGSLLGGRGVEGGLIRVTSVLGGLFMLLSLLISFVSH